MRLLMCFTLFVLVTGCRRPFNDREAELIGDWVLIERGRGCQMLDAPFNCSSLTPVQPTAPEVLIRIRKNGCIQELVGGEERDVSRITSAQVTLEIEELDRVRYEIDMKSSDRYFAFWIEEDTLRSFQLPEFLDHQSGPITEKSLGVFVRK